MYACSEFCVSILCIFISNVLCFYLASEPVIALRPVESVFGETNATKLVRCCTLKVDLYNAHISLSRQNVLLLYFRTKCILFLLMSLWAQECCKKRQPSFLAKCHKRRMNQSSFVLLYFAFFFCCFWFLFFLIVFHFVYFLYFKFVYCPVFSRTSNVNGTA